MVTLSDIEGGHDLPLEINSLLDKFQCFVKSFKFHNCDNYIDKNHPSSIVAK